MKIEVDDNKIHIDHNIATDPESYVRYARDIQLGIVHHALTFESTSTLVFF